MKTTLIVSLFVALLAAPAIAEDDGNSGGGNPSVSFDGPNIGPFVTPKPVVSKGKKYWGKKKYTKKIYVKKVKVVTTYKVKVVETYKTAYTKKKSYGHAKAYGYAKAASAECDCVLSNLMGTHWEDGCQKMNFSYSEAARLRAFYGI